MDFGLMRQVMLLHLGNREWGRFGQEKVEQQP